MVSNGKDYVRINKPIFLKEYVSYQGIFEGWFYEVNSWIR
jgi:hypothetical protein